MIEPRPRAKVYRAYWTFAAERQSIFESRMAGLPEPWTKDEILQAHRFTNTFRAADRVSQHLIRHAAYGYPEATEMDLFLRVVFHRLFSRPATWDLLEREVGHIEVATFDVDLWDRLLVRALADGDKLYTGAFILCASRSYGFERKHRNHLALLEAMLADGVPDRIGRADTFEDVYDELRSWPLLGPFMAYQIAIDLNYSTLINFSEDEFTIPGPGALRGMEKVFEGLGDLSPPDVVHWLVDQQERVFNELEIEPPTLFGRRLFAIDCQNLLCEIDKYCRQAFPELASDRTRIKQRFRADDRDLMLFFPPKWGVNSRIPVEWRADVDDIASV